MRLLDPEHDRVLDKIYLGFKAGEAREMIDALKQLLEHYEEPSYRSRLSDSDHKHEIRLAIYTESNLKYFDGREQRLILEEE